MSNARPIGGKLFTKTFFICTVFALVGLFFLVRRFAFGIGAVSGMSDGFPWGIWIAYDVVIGTAFACGGYAVALLVYVFNKGEYHPLIRPALLASVLGYSLAGISVFIDIGRYWQGFNILLPWYNNYNSVLLEVALCIATYILVLWIEFSPALLDKESLPGRIVNRVLFFFIALGILLPTMHQSSLGSVLILAGNKLSPLWWTGLLPLLFLISAIFMGYAVVIFESLLSSISFQRPTETPMLAKLSAVIPYLVGVYLIIRFADVLIRGQLGLAFNGTLRGNMFLIENILHIIPLILLANQSNRYNPKILFIAAVSLMLAGALFRFNAYIIGFTPGDGWQYFPAVPELLITFGIVAVEIMGYLWVVRKFPVLPSHKHA